MQAAQKLEFDEIIESRGLKVPFVPQIITPNIEKPLRNGRYESGEIQLLNDIVRPDDRVLDLGGGLGLVSTTAALAATNGKVISVEAHPELLPLIRETWRLNEVTNAELRGGLIASTTGKDGAFYLRHDFWASSAEPESRPFEKSLKVQTLGLDTLVEELRPTVICCDVEGAEDGLFDSIDLSSVRSVVIETHPKVYGTDRQIEIIRMLGEKGLAARKQEKTSTVFVFDRTLSREAAWAKKKPSAKPKKSTGAAKKPRIMLATCMKDEGPFILEWLAWHKAIGVTDFVVFSNDCSDGTDALLDRLDEMGEITHLTNPATAIGSTYLQPVALNYVQTLPVYRQCDYFLSMDVDEFINVKVGKGLISDLIKAVPEFDILSMCEMNHGANGEERFRRGWVTEIFPRHSKLAPGKFRSRVGVKSLTRISPRIAKVRNHRPDIAVEPSEIVWLDGSGNSHADLAEDASQNGTDCRGRRNLVSLEHYPLRSLDSFMVKTFRGDVVNVGKKISFRYWRVRNRHDDVSPELSKGIVRAKKYNKKYEADAELMALHENSCLAHEARIEELNALPEYIERREQILKDAWWPPE